MVIKKFLIFISIIFFFCNNSFSLNFKSHTYPARVVGKNVRLRTSPSLDSNIIRELLNEEPVEILFKTDFIERINNSKSYWYQIKTQKREKGWVYGNYVKIVKQTDENLIQISDFSLLNPKYKFSMELLNWGVCVKPDIFNSNLSLITIRDDQIHIVYIYNRYVVINKVTDHKLLGFSVYLKVPNLEFHKYLTEGKSLYDSEFPGSFRGIFRSYLFIDYGTGAGVRGLEIIDLNSKEDIYSGAWDNGEIKILSNSKVIVYKFKNETKPDKTNDFLVHNIIYENILNLDTKQYEPTGKTKMIVTN